MPPCAALLHKVANQLEDYREAISDFEDTNNQLMNLKINTVMKTFTSLSFLTFPFMLLAALFSMNTQGTPIINLPNAFWIVFGIRNQHADATHALALLRARRERHRRRAAEKGDELAAFHSITSSANARSFAEISRPIALAVFRLRTNSNLVGCTTGRRAGFSPLRTRPT